MRFISLDKILVNLNVSAVDISCSYHSLTLMRADPPSHSPLCQSVYILEMVVVQYGND